MKLGRALTYAVYALAYLNRESGGQAVHSKQIAEFLGASPDYLSKILQQLVRTRILASERGRTGGFRLKRPAADISLLDVLVAIEGSTDGGVEASNTSAVQVVRARLVAISAQICEFAHRALSRTTLDDLCREWTEQTPSPIGSNAHT